MKECCRIGVGGKTLADATALTPADAKRGD
jgi:hypothetical protein